LSIRTEDIAKFGQFYLQKGKWQGKQLVPAEWIDAATARQTSNGSNPDSDWDQGYGYQFWRSRNNAFRGDGAFGQYCIVLPEHDAVVVITSGVRDMQAVLNLVWDKLLPAFHTESLPADEAASKHLLSKLQGLTLQPISGTTETRSALGKTYYFPQNRAKLESIRLERQEETTSWVAQIDGKERCLAFRPAVWQKSRVAWGLFPEQPGATTGAWTSKDTFTAKICYYETPFILTMRLAFSGDEVRLNAETSVGFGPTKQAELVGSTTKPEPGSGREAAARAASDDRFQKWEEEISAFEKSDRETPPKKGGILFIGSSTIRLWKTLETDFPHHQVINRGFGGSEIADATHFAERIIFPYEPVQIFLRAGGNDIHNGKVPEEVAADFAAFVKKVRERLPNTEILYISVSPAPARWGENDKYRDLNRRIREMALGMPRVGVVDAYDVPLNPDGTARRDMFIEDLLHFNARGYKALAEVVRPYLPVAKR
jgi:lysophospholipase L1-like esterase